MISTVTFSNLSIGSLQHTTLTNKLPTPSLEFLGLCPEQISGPTAALNILSHQLPNNGFKVLCTSIANASEKQFFN